MTAPLPGVPDLATVRAWVDVPAAEISDDQLRAIIAAELDLQLTACGWDEGPYPGALAQALLRRCARHVAARSLPLGTLPPGTTGLGGEYGALWLPRLDAEIERFEGPFREIPVA